MVSILSWIFYNYNLTIKNIEKGKIYFSIKPPPLVEDPERFYRSGVK